MEEVIYGVSARQSVRLSAASVFNFNQDAFNRLEPFEPWVRKQRLESKLLNTDETGINIAGKGHWLHGLPVSRIWVNLF